MSLCRIMGLDLGTVTCGVSISDPLGIVARNITTIRFANEDYADCLNQLLSIIRMEQPGKIVLGLPKHMNGDIGVRAQASIDFKTMLEEKVSVPIILWDERLTTAAAEKILIKADLSRKKRKQVIDQMAAVQILQSYLDANQH